LVWLHTVVSGLRRRDTLRLREVAIDGVGAGA